MIVTVLTGPLPRDYDPSAVRHLINAQRQSLQEAPGLVFMAHGLRGDLTHSPVSQYAAAAVWSNSSRMAEYLWGDLLAGLRSHLGLPCIEVLPVASVQVNRLALATADTMMITRSRTADPEDLAERAIVLKADARRVIQARGKHAAVRAVDLGTGLDVSVDVMTGAPRNAAGDVFRVLHISAPEPPPTA